MEPTRSLRERRGDITSPTLQTNDQANAWLIEATEQCRRDPLAVNKARMAPVHCSFPVPITSAEERIYSLFTTVTLILLLEDNEWSQMLKSDCQLISFWANNLACSEGTRYRTRSEECQGESAGRMSR